MSSLKRENATRRAFLRLLVRCARRVEDGRDFRFIKHAPPSPRYGESRLFSGSAAKNRLPLLRLKKEKKRKKKRATSTGGRAVSGELEGCEQARMSEGRSRFVIRAKGRL